MMDFSDLRVKATGKLEKAEGKWMISKIILSPVLTIPSSRQEERAERILYKSEASCLISNSIKSEIVFNPEVIVADIVSHSVNE